MSAPLRGLAALLSPPASLLGWALSLLPAAGARRAAERFGYYPEGTLRGDEGEGVLWIHAASAGEVRAVEPLARRFREARPGARILLTATSASGRRLGRDAGFADAARFAPSDLPSPVDRALRAFRPRLLAVAETELWPVLFTACTRRGVPVVLVNGRISDQSFPVYRRFAALFRETLRVPSRFLVQTETDAQRFRILGVPPDRVEVAGQMKYDLIGPDAAAAARFAEEVGLSGGGPVFTLGSLRAGEEALLAAVPGLLASSLQVRVIVAPRYREDVPRFERELARLGVASRRRTLGSLGEGCRVLVLDTLGELPLAWAGSRGAFVGGTFAAGVGGHNVLEPALAGVPTAFGPHTGNVREAADALERTGGGRRVASPADLEEFLRSLLSEREFYSRREGARAAVAGLRGATARTLARLLAHWDSAPSFHRKGAA